jgi:hypothetical protein
VCRASYLPLGTGDAGGEGSGELLGVINGLFFMDKRMEGRGFEGEGDGDDGGDGEGDEDKGDIGDIGELGGEEDGDLSAR